MNLEFVRSLLQMQVIIFESELDNNYELIFTCFIHIGDLHNE